MRTDQPARPAIELGQALEGANLDPLVVEIDGHIFFVSFIMQFYGPTVVQVFMVKVR